MKMNGRNGMKKISIQLNSGSKEMSKTTNEGYLMEDNTLVPFKKLEMGDVSPEHIEELNNSMASVLDLVLLNNRLFDWKDEIKNSIANQIVKLEKSFMQHSAVVPINEVRIKEILRSELMSENVRELMQKELMDAAIKKLNKGSRIIRYAWRAVVVFLILFNAWLLSQGKIPIHFTP